MDLDIERLKYDLINYLGTVAISNGSSSFLLIEKTLKSK